MPIHAAHFQPEPLEPMGQLDPGLEAGGGVAVEALLTMEEAAQLLRLSIGYVRKMVMFDETFRTVKIMRCDALDAWVLTRRERTPKASL